MPETAQQVKSSPKREISAAEARRRARLKAQNRKPRAYHGADGKIIRGLVDMIATFRTSCHVCPEPVWPGNRIVFDADANVSRHWRCGPK